MADIDTSELDDVQRDLAALEVNLRRKVPSAVEDEVENLIEAIQNKIVQKGLVGDPSDKPGQPPLVASFKKNSSGSSEWTIYSTAEHAMAIEEGASPHRIEPDDAALLAWEPESPAAYPTKDEIEGFPQTWYDPDDGMVYSTGVSHPGNEAYHYIAEAQAQWAPIAHIQIEQAVQAAIVQSGFKPSSGRGGGLDSDPDFVGGGL